MNNILPGSPAPQLEVDLLNGTRWSLADQRPVHFTMLVFYRHSQCGICNGYLKQLDDLAGVFADAGVNILAASVDNAAATRQMIAKLDLKNLRFGCQISLDIAKKWGLFVSQKLKDTEPDYFLEPALFLINRSVVLYYASIQSMPFGRSSPSEILQWIPKLIENEIPARGEVMV
jgi:peroxiredoxin